MNTLRVTGVIIFSLILILFSNIAVFSFVHLGIVAYKSFWFDLVSSLVFCVMLLGVPIVITSRFLKLPLSAIGVRFPENTKASLLCSFCVIAIFLPVIILFSKQTAFISYYAIKLSFLPFVVSVGASAAYYLAEEFFFHGFLLLYIQRWMGLHSIWITSVLFAWLHLGKPLPEIVFAFFLGIALSLLSLKTKSFLPAAFVHFILAAALIICIQV